MKFSFPKLLANLQCIYDAFNRNQNDIFRYFQSLRPFQVYPSNVSWINVRRNESQFPIQAWSRREKDTKESEGELQLKDRTLFSSDFSDCQLSAASTSLLTQRERKVRQ